MEKISKISASEKLSLPEKLPRRCPGRPRVTAMVAIPESPKVISLTDERAYDSQAPIATVGAGCCGKGIRARRRIR